MIPVSVALLGSGITLVLSCTVVALYGVWQLSGMTEARGTSRWGVLDRRQARAIRWFDALFALGVVLILAGAGARVIA